MYVYRTQQELSFELSLVLGKNMIENQRQPRLARNHTAQEFAVSATTLHGNLYAGTITRPRAS